MIKKYFGRSLYSNLTIPTSDIFIGTIFNLKVFSGVYFFLKHNRTHNQI